MYNGIGLKSARGSGTNGYVQKNLSFVKPKSKNNSDYKYEENPPAPPRKPNDDVLLHKARRQVEVEVLEYREKLEEGDKYTEEEIETKVIQKRKELLEKLETRMTSMKESVLMEAKEKEMHRMKDAFGIKDDFREGRGFNFETEKKRQERLERVAGEERARRFRPY